jgi:hypothetical protein
MGEHYNSKKATLPWACATHKRALTSPGLVTARSLTRIDDTYKTWITLRGFKSKKLIWLESCWGASSRDLNHVEGIQVGETYMTRITLRGFELKLESRWGDSSRRNLYDSNHVEGIRAKTWITLRGFKSEKLIWDSNHIEMIRTRGTYETRALQSHHVSRLLGTIRAQKRLGPP